MRHVMLDTETTGLSVAAGHRIIEIAAIEVDNRTVTTNVFQVYVNPQRAVDPGAFEVHGLSDEFLEDKPTFDLVVEDLLAFVKGSNVVMHNASFDIGFLNMELDKLGMGVFGDYCEEVIDSLTMARRLHPGRRNSLDALCERYAIDRSSRTLHGALIDTQLLAEVYLAMTRGQDSLLGEDNDREKTSLESGFSAPQSNVLVLQASQEELERHAKYLEALEKKENVKPVWLNRPD
ncbi:MAG: DNA polymerase III subunit epsilon [Proteobacteria bacterium]|nr:DNA polymerase III subunit epsilon [Pseudomonadota bacterium]MDA0862612.1 DNA polymerase III subunit epsilon [Pseudomonadota bacterium]MDA1031670.1 DNA polymerase III subunit epsilon [Pseudomonadota bacterium]